MNSLKYLHNRKKVSKVFQQHVWRLNDEVSKDGEQEWMEGEKRKVLLGS